MMKLSTDKILEGEKTMVMIFAGIAFVTLFCAWVIVPTFLKKRHTHQTEITEE
jgi:hypothetical protein